MKAAWASEVSFASNLRSETKLAQLSNSKLQNSPVYSDVSCKCLGSGLGQSDGLGRLGLGATVVRVSLYRSVLLVRSICHKRKR
jgi:hypothetical protein